MAVLDYYSLLGLPAGESARGIDAAYRDFLRHGEQSAGMMRRGAPELVRAFAILSTPSARRSYDDTRNSLEAGMAPMGNDVFAEAESLLASRDSVHPSFEALFDRLARNFTGHGVPKGEHPESITVEFELRADEFSQRRTIPIGIPTFELCPECDGVRHVALFPCRTCGGAGFVERTQTVRCETGPEPMVERSLEDLGIYNCYLRLNIRIVNC